MVYRSIWKCTFCSEVLKDQACFFEHRRIVHNIEKFVCHYCNKEYCNPIGRSRHERKSHKEQQQTLLNSSRCEMVKETEVKGVVQSFEYWKMVDPNTIKMTYKCHFCHNEYCSNKARTLHEKVFHSETIYKYVVVKTDYKTETLGQVINISS
jgi:hypothetical protein